MVFVASQAFAQVGSPSNRQAARDEGYRGVAHFQAGDYAAAFAELDHAYGVLQAPTLGLWSARALVKLNRWVQASERFRAVLRSDPKLGDAAVQQQALADTAKELESVQAKMPALRIGVAGAPPTEVVVLLDGQPFSAELVGERVPANPGAHVIEARWKDQKTGQKVALVESQEGRVTLSFVSPTASAGESEAAARVPTAGPSTGRKTLAWAMMGVGAAGIAVGASAGILALGKKSSLEGSSDCRAQQCLPTQQGAVAGYNTLRVVSGVGLIAGAVVAGAGLIVLLTADASPAKTAGGTRDPVWLAVTAGRLQFGGSF
jgi:hypothetical protein